MRHTRGEAALLVVALTAFAACADPANRIDGSTRSTGVTETGSIIGTGQDERAALTSITRLVAQALDNEPARQHLKRDMRAAPFREHKLQLGAYLRSQDGKALLKRMVELSGATENDVFNAVNTVRPMEFYMPFAGHREKWTGKDDILVVSQLEESEPIVAFDEKGQSVALDRNAPPVQPTLSIIPVETDFDKPMNPLRSRNARDENGAAIGTLEDINAKTSSILACDASCSGSGTELLAPPTDGSGGGTLDGLEPGLYLTFSRILDMKEPWFRGDPEIEVHIHGPTDPAAPLYGEDLSCAGEHVVDIRKNFDQNTGFWSGHVMLFSAAEVNSYIQKFSDGFHVIFWEDDNSPCVLKLDTQTLVESLKAVAGAAGTVAVKITTKVNPWVAAGAFVATVFGNAGSWLLTNDDYLGVAVDKVKAGYDYPDNTHVIMDGLKLNGRATIIYKP